MLRRPDRWTRPLSRSTHAAAPRSSGAAPGSDSAAEKTLALKKLSRLLAFAQTHGGLDSSKTPKEIDLRPKDAEPAHRQTARSAVPVAEPRCLVMPSYAAAQQRRNCSREVELPAVYGCAACDPPAGK